MAGSWPSLLLALCLAQPLRLEASEATPIQKVLVMLNEMKAKAVVAIKDEQVVYAGYEAWAKSQVEDLTGEIAHGEAEIEKLSAIIAKAHSDAAALQQEIDELTAHISSEEAEQKALSAKREADRSIYVKTQADYAESVDALERAIQILGSQNYDRPQAMMLLEKIAHGTPGMQRVIAALVDSKAVLARDRENYAAPEANAYEFQSSKIMDMLKDLLDKFSTELGDVEKAEMNSQHNFNVAMLHLGNTISDLKASSEKKATMKAKLLTEAARAQGDLSIVEADLAENKKTLKETESVFAAKKQTYEQNQVVRAAEVEALSKAIEILSNPQVTNGVNPRSMGGLQTGAASVTSFIQVSSKAIRRAQVKARVVALLQQKAGALSSSNLLKLAEEAKSNPFQKVVDMIKALLTRLEEEAAAEAAHKEWCDKELHDNKIIRDKKSAEIQTLLASIDGLKAQIASMKKEIETLVEEQAALATAMTEATKTRQAEKTENAATIKDAQEAQVAVKQAVEVLDDWYGKQALLQKTKRQVPEMEAYTGMKSVGGSDTNTVMGMLEIILSDFARVEADTEAAEATAASEYKAFMKETKATIESKHKREFKLSLELDQAEYELSRDKKDLEAVQKEYDAAVDYFSSLKPMCIEVKVSFEERAKKRQEEIDALNEAYKILDSADFGL